MRHTELLTTRPILSLHAVARLQVREGRKDKAIPLTGRGSPVISSEIETAIFRLVAQCPSG